MRLLTCLNPGPVDGSRGGDATGSHDQRDVRGLPSPAVTARWYIPGAAGDLLHTSHHLGPPDVPHCGSKPARAAALAERARIARELHDTLSQTLYVIALSASRGLSLLRQNQLDEVQDSIADVLQLANTGQTELRALVTDLRSDHLNANLASLGAQTRARGAVDVHMSLPDEPDVPAAVKWALVMICREALHNIVKHAAARCVDIVLEVVGDRIVLLIADDGRGFDPAAPRPHNFGLESMQERAAAAGGTLELVSAKDIGTQVRVWVPLALSRSR